MPVAEHIAHRREPLPADDELVGWGRGSGDGGQLDERDRELIAGECARLVGRDQRATPEAFDRGQPPHDGTTSRHPARGDGQGDRERHGKALGDRRDGQHHRKQEHLSWLLADHHANQADHGGSCNNCHRDRAGEPLHAGDERRLAGGAGRHVDSQFPDACPESGGDDDG